jgi:hypothetical protein
LTNQLIEYIKLNRLSMSQDLDLIENHEVTNEGYPKEYLQGAIACMDHILEYANEL